MTEAASREEKLMGGLVPILGLYCLTGSCVSTFPDFLSFQVKGEVLCFKQHLLCCKVGDEADPNEMCVVNQVKCTIVKPTVLIKGIAQLFCLDTRCSLPLDKDMPRFINFFGFSCCYCNEVTGCAFIGTCCSTIAKMEHATGGTKYGAVAESDTAAKA